jgi:hypothetical protein
VYIILFLLVIVFIISFNIYSYSHIKRCRDTQHKWQVTLSSVTYIYCWSKCHKPRVIVLSLIMLYVIKLNVVVLSFSMWQLKYSVYMLSFVMLSDILLSIRLSFVMLSVIKLNTIMLSVIILSVAAPLKSLQAEYNLFKAMLFSWFICKDFECFQDFSPIY